MGSVTKHTNCRRNIITGVCIGIIPLIFLFIPIIAAFPPEHAETEPGGAIAHGGGVYAGQKCTNSVEAVENAVSCGISLIEMDIAQTTDGGLAALHDWTKFRKYCGMAEGRPLPLEEVKSARMFGNLTPVTVEYIDSLMSARKDLRLVLDKETGFNFIDGNLGKFKDRIIVECFDARDYVKYRSSGYLLPMMSGKPTIRFCVTVFLKTLFAGHPMFCGCYAVDIGELNSGRTMNPFKRIYSPDLAVYTLPDLAAADSLMKSDKRVKFVYVDNIDAK